MDRAAGDVANMDNPLYHTRIRVEHWANAVHGGAAAARSMLGQQVIPEGVGPVKGLSWVC